MGGMSRTKGATGERELAGLLSALTGFEVRRRVRNLAGEDDLAGLPGWSIECKRYRQITPALVAGWWQQAIDQAARINCRPVLLYRADRGAWRARWPAALHAGAGHQLTEHCAVESDLPTWWALVREAVGE